MNYVIEIRSWTYPPARIDKLGAALPKAHKGTMWEGISSVDGFREFPKL